MRSIWVVMAGVGVGLAVALTGQPAAREASGTPTSQPKKIEALTVLAPAALDARFKNMPDRLQADWRLPNGGKEYCGPTAVSDAIWWFAEHGNPQLKPPGQDPQLTIIRKLSLLMKTDPEKGTAPRLVLEGLKGYLEAAGVKNYTIEFYGRRAAPTWCKPLGDDPTPEWLAAMNRGTAVTFLHVGWYKAAPKDAADGKKYARSGGHWLAAIAAGLDENGRDDPLCVTVVDSAPLTGPEWKKHTARLVEVHDPELPGKWKLEGLAPRKGVVVALLQNAVGVRIGE